MIIPIRTETPVRRTPTANCALIALNVFCFLILDGWGQPDLLRFKLQRLMLHTDFPSLHEFVTYQFIHADWMHLLGNMLFLWVFGNAVNAKMGHAAYVLFYLGGGVFAACGFSLGAGADLLGASGSIAGITTAYLVLFPRSRITVLYWLFFIGTFEVPAMIMIGIKIILWDNMIAPSIGSVGNVATGAHLAGYLFGFVASVAMLLIRALPRDQFDLLALLKRWKRRQAYRQMMADPQARAQAQFGRVARPMVASPQQQAREETRLDRVSELRTQVGESLERGDLASAANLYEQLVAADTGQCLSARSQMLVAREFFATGRYPQAAAAFERYLASYAASGEANEIRLLLGIVYARDLHQYETAEKHLATAYHELRDPSRRDQCCHWLSLVRSALGKSVPDPPG